MHRRDIGLLENVKKKITLDNHNDIEVKDQGQIKKHTKSFFMK